jgi:hypothetical protein
MTCEDLDGFGFLESWKRLVKAYYVAFVFVRILPFSHTIDKQHESENFMTIIVSS